MNKWESKSDRL